VAWGFTDGFNDVQDLYEEHLRVNTQGQLEYEFKGEWLPAEVRQEEIRVKGGKTVVEEVTVTRHGPIINLMVEQDFPDTPPLAMKWTALEPETTMQAIVGINLARNCAELHQALADFSGPGQNTVYADTQGNIGYTLFGRTPIRAKGDGSVPVPGWTGEYEWIGFIPFDEMPHLDNPPKGYVATANNPQSRNLGEHFISRDYCQVDRAARIVELIEQNPKIDIGYIQKM
jgi:penicillin amidase